MNRVFDYNGTMVAPSTPVKKLKTVKKKLLVDSGDRDKVKFSTNGDFVVYLPRVYENVVSIRLEAGEFPPLTTDTILDANTAYASEPLISVDLTTNNYFLIDIEGLNKTDECSMGADRSGYPDGTFAKIPFVGQIATTDPVPLFYSDSGSQENIAKYSPAIGKLDRMHIRTRLHTQKASGDWFFWKSGEYSLTFEIEYLDNVFDDFSQFESRISDRA